MNNTYNRILNLVTEAERRGKSGLNPASSIAQKRSVLDLARSHMQGGDKDPVVGDIVSSEDAARGQSPEGARKSRVQMRKNRVARNWAGAMERALDRGRDPAPKPGFFRRNSPEAIEAKAARKAGRKARTGTTASRTPEGKAARRKANTTNAKAALDATNYGDM